MSGRSIQGSIPGPGATRLRGSLARATAIVFGDRGGVVVFLATALSLGALWRVGIFVADSTTVANAVVNVAAGRLEIVDVPYSLTATGQPGLVESNGRLYARNYGHVYVAVALYGPLAVLTSVVPTALFLLGAWCLGLVALSRSAAGLLERPRLKRAGSALALVVLVGSLPGLSPISPDRTALVALQLSTVLVTAGAGTICYRLLARFHGRRVGLVAGGLVALATPLGFWASVPKRHAFTAALALAAVYCFAASRTSGRPATRAAGYAAVGLLASIHAFEAAVLLLAFAPIELLTAPDTDGRALAIIATVFVLSSAPMLATNAAISGNPLEPPRLLSGASDGGFPADLGAATDAAPGGTDDARFVPPPGRSVAWDAPDRGTRADRVASSPLSHGRGDGGAGNHRGPPLWLGIVFGVVDRLWLLAGFLIEAVVAGLAAATEPDRLFRVFVRSSWNSFVHYQVTDFEAIDLAWLEVFPVAGALAYVPVAAARRLRAGLRPALASLRSALTDPVRQTDLLVGTLAVTFVLVYLPRLPLQSQITLRYVVPAMALVAYGVARLSPVRRAIADAPLVLAAGYLLSTAAAVCGLSLAVAVLGLAVGEAMQLQALVGLAAACIVGFAVAGWPLHREERAVALGVAVPAGVTTAFLVLSALVYFPYGQYALEVARLVAEVLPALA